MSPRAPGGGRLKYAFVWSIGIACSTGETAAPTSSAQAVREPTYYDDIAPLLSQRCVKCHYTDGVAPFPLTSYEEAAAKSGVMSVEVVARRMPPWGAQTSAECVPPFGWQGDERLTEDEISLIRRWAARGAPPGELPTESTFAIASDPSRLAEPSLELLPRTSYLPDTTRDDFRCFVLDAPELGAGAFVSAIDVVPGDRRIVHHATVWADPGGIVSQRAGADGSFDCSDPGFDRPLTEDGPAPRLSWLVSWAPGAKPLELKPDVALEIPPRSKILMQIHYSVGGREIAPEASRLQLRLATTRPAFTLTSWSVGNWQAAQANGDGLLAQADDPPAGPVFLVPAWAEAHVEGMQNTSEAGSAMWLYGIRAHAHLAATDIKVDLVHTLGETEPSAGLERSQCLLQDRWDFHWQRVYSYDAPLESLPRIQPGDRIRLRCTYDNTMSNRRLGEELYQRGLQPTDIYLGDRTLDEMCMADLLYLKKLD